MRELDNKESFADTWQVNLRPKYFSDYMGQTKIKNNLAVYIEAARKRQEALDHVLLSGPPGLGKTTLAEIIANEMGAKFKITSAPAIERPADLASILTDLDSKDILFIDEIHRLPRNIEEILYSAMEDYALDIMIGKGAGARTVRLSLAPFTLVGATTKAGALTSPLRDRFGIHLHLEYYKPEELVQIVCRSANLLDVPITKPGAQEIAKRARGTPRIANRILKRIRDFAQVAGMSAIDEKIVDTALTMLEIDKQGLDATDRKLLLLLIHQFGGGPVGLETLTAALGEETATVEDVYEPYLLQNGFLNRTPRGRMASLKAYEHLGIAKS